MAYQPKSYRKFVATAATATLVASAVAPAASAAGLSDIDNHRHEDAIKNLVEKEIISGYPDGTFRPDTTITRAEGAIMIARALGILGDGETPETDFSDVHEMTQAYEAIVKLEEKGIISGYPDGTYRPDESITREAIAKYLVLAFEDKFEDADGDGTKFTDVSGDSSLGKYVEQLFNAGVTDGVNETQFGSKQEMKRGDFAAFTYRTLQLEDADADVAPEVVGVSAVNAKQLLVEYKKDIDVASAINTDNYEITEVPNGDEVVIDAIEVQDGKSVLITLDDNYRVSTELNVHVDGVYVKGSIKETIEEFSQIVNVHDTTAPSIVSATAVTSTSVAKDLTVELSEPIAEYEAFLVNGKAVNAAPVNDAETVYAIPELNLEAGSSNEVEIVNAVDYAENKAVSITKDFTVTQDTTAPKGAITAIDDNKIQVTFNEVVNADSVKNTENVKVFKVDEKGAYEELTTGEETGVFITGSGKNYTIHLENADDFYGTNDNTEEILVRVNSGVVDTFGNPVEAFHNTVTLTKDAAGPVLQDITFDKNSKGEVTKLYFAFDEILGEVSETLNVSVKDLRTNESVALNELLTVANVELASDGKTVIATLDTTPGEPVVKSGNYSFTVQPGFVQDDAAATNDNTRVAKEVNFGEAANVVEVATHVVENNTVLVGFSQLVTTESAKDPANYLFGGKALPEGTEIVVHEDIPLFEEGIIFAQAVEFELPSGFVVETGEVKVEVKNIQPIDPSAEFNDFTGVSGLTDNTRPTVNSTLLDNGVVEFTFSENVTVDDTDFASVRVNGKVLEDQTTFNFATVAEAAKDTVKLEVYADVTETAVDGKYYQFIDVDANNEYTTADILLAVSDDVLPEDWVDGMTVDLNDVDVSSVKVTTDNSTSTADKAGNKLAPNSTITVK
jgi:hypothetical protein